LNPYSILFFICQEKEIKIVFTSDLHFGLKRAHFRNSKDSVTSEKVNRAMVESIKSLGKVDLVFPEGIKCSKEKPIVQTLRINSLFQLIEPQKRLLEEKKKAIRLRIAQNLIK